MASVKTITATTTESTVEFSATYQFMWFRNFGENDCYICAHSGIVANADDVTLLKAGELARLTLPQSPAQSRAYIKAADGSNTVEVHAQNFSDCTFKRQGKGGEQITVESLTATENKTYTAPTGTAYSPVVVNVPDIPAVIQSLTVTGDGTYTAPSGVDGYSPVVVDTSYHLPDGYTQLDHIICPSTTEPCGFEITSYTQRKQGDIHELTIEPLRIDSVERAFAGIDDDIELYINPTGSKFAVWCSTSGDAVSLQNATSMTLSKITLKVLINATKTGNLWSIGYYASDRYAYNGKIYRYKIYRAYGNNTAVSLIYDFIPAKRNSDDKVGMYDAVNDVFYYSATGTDFGEPT